MTAGRLPSGMPPDAEFGPARVAETHVSTLFFVAERVFKLKKPVSLGFLDFSTREAREAACHREVELNRRLAPDVYLGVADVTLDGQFCDHLVVMRRLPERLRLASLVRQGRSVENEVRDVARLLAAFHARGRRSNWIDQTGSPESVRANWEDNFAQMQPFVGSVLDPAVFHRVEQLVCRYLHGRGALLRHRIAQGRVCDGHGDLQAEDMFCLEDGPRILDCIEFDDRLRAGDVLADVAFLAMDLERLGAAPAARLFLDAYREFAADWWPVSLAHHWIAYRAHVRSKVACLSSLGGDPAAETAAQTLLELARNHLEHGQISLTLVGGLPGTGKSTLATGLANRTGWPVLRSDEIRKDLAGIAHDQSAAAAYREGLYTADMSDATYRELLRRARVALEMGESVILDASWTDSNRREWARQVAAETTSLLVELRCVVDAPIAADRMIRRRWIGHDPSDADPTVAARMADDTDPWPSAVHIDTSARQADAVAAAWAKLSDIRFAPLPAAGLTTGA